MEPLLMITHLNKEFKRGGTRIPVVKDLSLSVYPGQCLGLVGESGCGKSTLCRMIVGLNEPDSGEIFYDGRPIRDIWGTGQIQMVFQNSLDAVNLHWNAFQIISEPLENFFHMKKVERVREVGHLMEMVGLSAEDMRKYPQQFSGGQLQRVCIARALAAKPKLLVLDEPLSSLDVSVQAQILNFLLDLMKELHLTCILVSHDLKAVYYLADQIFMMNEGRCLDKMWYK